MLKMFLHEISKFPVGIVCYHP